MKILLTNDDGWQADGLGVLYEVARSFGEVWVVAPNSPQSGISHQLTLDRPMELVERAPRFFSLEGTPADCARVGINHLGQNFDWVWSGINHGANLGSDIYVSGTFAAAREASLFGVSAIALSQYRLGLTGKFDWSQTKQLAASSLAKYVSIPDSECRLVNLNFPDRSRDGGWQQVELIDCNLDPCPLPFDYAHCEEDSLQYSGSYHERQREKGCDVDICFSGNISATVIN